MMPNAEATPSSTQTPHLVYEPDENGDSCTKQAQSVLEA